MCKLFLLLALMKGSKWSVKKQILFFFFIRRILASSGKASPDRQKQCTAT